MLMVLTTLHDEVMGTKESSFYICINESFSRIDKEQAAFLFWLRAAPRRIVVDPNDETRNVSNIKHVEEKNHWPLRWDAYPTQGLNERAN